MLSTTEADDESNDDSEAAGRTTVLSSKMVLSLRLLVQYATAGGSSELFLFMVGRRSTHVPL